MAEKIKLVQGDNRPSLVCTITDENTDAPISIDGALVRLKFRETGSTELKSTLTGSVVDGANGIVVFHWFQDPQALNGQPGPYEGEIEITFPDGQVQTLYQLLKFQLREDF